MKPEYIVIPSIFVAFAIAEIVRTNFFHKQNQYPRDGVVEAASTVLLLALTQPAILLMAALLMGAEYLVVGRADLSRPGQSLQLLPHVQDVGHLWRTLRHPLGQTFV